MTVDQFRTKIREITHTSTNDYTDASLIRDLNDEMRAIKVNIQRDRGVLEFDDANYTDVQIATIPLVASQTTYKITEDEDGNAITTIHKVAVLQNDVYVDVPRIKLGETTQDGLVDNTSALVPNGYYEVGQSIVFTQSPAQSSTIKVWFDRDIDIIVTGDTTKVPGIPLDYHNLLAYRVSYNYALDKGLPNEDRILRRIQLEDERLKQYEENRRDDEATRITVESVTGL
jgi:hypothetical protein